MKNCTNSVKLESLTSWFQSITPTTWFKMAKIAKQEDILSGKERVFLFNMGRLASKEELPSEKQLIFLKSVFDKFEKELKDIEASKMNKKIRDVATSNSIKHMTLRVAWHANNWDGKVCKDPASNDYCIGEYSLLSRRIRQERNLEIEKEKAGHIPDLENWDYVPPCFWSINMLGENPVKVQHINPAANEFPYIKDQLDNFSVFTWPFKHSFNHDSKAVKREGKYPANLVPRIEKYQKKFYGDSTIVFLYANYSNPISGDEDKYLILGCALLKKMESPDFFKPSEEQLKARKAKSGNQNFPTINWAFKVQLDLPENGILLPYYEYLKEAEETNFYDRLNEIKVTVDETELIQSFKYVSLDIDDDQAIYILSKIRKSLYIIKGHNRFENYDVDSNIERAEHFLDVLWNKRGHFPGFEVLSNIILNTEFRKKVEFDKIINLIKDADGDNYAEKLSEILAHPDNIDEYLEEYEDVLFELSEAIEVKGLTSKEYLKLCMLNLNFYQFKKIISSQFSDRPNSLKAISENPYLLYEEYQSDGKEDPDSGDSLDFPIELFRIDIAFFPERFIKRIRKLQDLRESDPRRIRALIIDFLEGQKPQGNCFDEASSIQQYLKNYPLFYKSDYIIKEDILYELKDNDHLKLKLKIIPVESGKVYYYLKEVFLAEQNVSATLLQLLSKNNITETYNFKLQDYIKESTEVLKQRIGNFDAEEFKAEREKLFAEVLSKRFYIISGAPGSGKSNVILELINIFNSNGETNNILLAPTGKATLRLNLNEEKIESIKAQTIDKFLTDSEEESDGSIIFNNLIIDEMSMVDLLKVQDLFKKLNFSSNQFRRLIFVGDYNQLPPIGLGRVFVDTINFLKSGQKENHFTYLQVNCRQELDSQVLDFARIFSNQNKNYEPLLKKVISGESPSENFNICYWKSRQELRAVLLERFKYLFDVDNTQFETALNKLLGLRDNGYVDNTEYKFAERLTLDRFQVITPYKTSFYGTLGLNNYFQDKFRKNAKFIRGDFPFKQGDKVIQVQNKYSKKELILSNGSIGIVSSDQFYFPEYAYPFTNDKMDNSMIELAYAITVHKSQGSGFDHVFLVIPEKLTLLSRELLYTALTRSRKTISIFVFGETSKNMEKSILYTIRNTSHIDIRKTSLFKSDYWDYSYSPDKNVKVKSRVEYIIYKKLKEYAEKTPGFTFYYEREYELDSEPFNIHPDFTICFNDKTFYLEHLGKIGHYQYEKDWYQRLKFYKMKNDFENLITTDELKGINDERITQMIEDILSGTIKETNPEYSRHHYSLA